MYLFTIDTADMGRPKHALPNLRTHAASQRDFIIYNGAQIYLGPAGSAESVAAYQSICANITSHGTAIWQPRTVWTVGELVNEYRTQLPKTHPAESKEPQMIGLALRDLVANFAQIDAAQFSPAKFLALRQIWIDRKKAVSTVNKWHNYVLNLFRWAAMTDLLPASVWHILLTVPKLKPGRSPAKPAKKVGPVPMEHVEAIRPLVSQQVRDAIDLQLLTGMRSGEVLGMTTGQIVGNVYRPEKHKTKWRGHVRTIPLGPKAMAIVQRRTESGQDRLFRLRVDSYAEAIKRACLRANVPHWHPHQLRHAAGTRVRDAHGLDAAQAFLGHASAKTSEIYAKIKAELADRVAEEG